VSTSRSSARALGLQALAMRGGNARSVLFNLAGAAAPAALALLAVPRMTAQLGPARFGVLALAWTAVGYAALLHLGLGRAVARDTAAARAGDPPDALRATVWTAASMTALAGVLGALLLVLAAPRLAAPLRLSPGLAAEAVASFRILALAIPFTVSTPVLSGVLEARRRFDLVNVVVIPSAAVTYLGPVLALLFTRRLEPLVATVAAGRVLAWLGYLLLCLRVAPELRRPHRFRGEVAAPLLRFGGWTTVSAAVSPLLVYLDRFVIAATLSTSAVAYYATSQEVVVRLGMVSAAVVGVLFPAFAAVPPERQARLGGLLESGIDAVLLLVLPLALLLAAGAELLLRLWLGGLYGMHGGPVLAWLAVGLLANGLARIPAALLPAIGRPDLNARLHLVELPLFVALLAVLVRRWGIEGAAMAWVARVTADGIGLYWLALRQVPSARVAVRRAATVAAAGALGIASLRLADGPLPRVLLLALAGVALAAAARGVLHRRASAVALAAAEEESEDGQRARRGLVEEPA
jgi:O-antigen/teichoic acid export membrane protein